MIWIIDYFSFDFLLVMNDPIEHATGIEKRELLAKQQGNDNPFDMKVLKRGVGTKENPNCIPSAFDARLVGCICKIYGDCKLKADFYFLSLAFFISPIHNLLIFLPQYLIND